MAKRKICIKRPTFTIIAMNFVQEQLKSKNNNLKFVSTFFSLFPHKIVNNLFTFLCVLFIALLNHWLSPLLIANFKLLIGKIAKRENC